jgi:hypothetical protein
VTGVDRAAKEDLVRSLGAAHYVDFEELRAVVEP